MTTKKDEEWIKDFKTLVSSKQKVIGTKGIETVYIFHGVSLEKHIGWLKTLLTEKNREIEKAYTKGRSDEAKACTSCQGECEKRVEAERERIIADEAGCVEYKRWCDMQQQGTKLPSFDEWLSTNTRV